jgi:hypothetical protein
VGGFVAIQRQPSIFSYMLCDDIGAGCFLGGVVVGCTQRSDFILTELQGSLSFDSCATGKTLAQEGAYSNKRFSKGVAMMIVILMGVLVGAVLGLRFKMFVLVSVFCAGLPFIIVGGISRGDGFWRVALAMIVLATSVQVGYTLGSVLQSVIGVARAGNHGRVSMPTSAPMSGSV